MSCRKLVFGAALFLAPLANAADGVVEINQSCALGATGCFAGDASGFPVSISQPGSYQLTSNLTIAGVDTIGVSIAAEAVTLDLNGFAISGPNTFVNDTPGCAAGSSLLGSAAGTGVYSFEDMSVVRNGIVRQMGSNGVFLNGRNSRIERIIANHNCGIGLRIGEASVVTDSHSHRSRLEGIVASTSSLGGGSLVERSVVYDNMSYGIRVGAGSHALACVVSRNRALGYFGQPGSGVGDSVFTNNTGGVGGGLGVGCNMFDGAVLCAP